MTNIGQRSVVPSMDPVEMKNNLTELMDVYKDVLKFTERLPLVGKFEPGEVLGARWWRRWLFKPLISVPEGAFFRPLVKLLVTSHIRGRLDAIIKHLRIERMAITDDSDLGAKAIESYVKQLTESRSTLAGENRIPRIASTALALALPLFPIAAAGLLRQGSDTLLIIGMLVVVGIYQVSLVLVLPMIVQAGFEGKRALFAGKKIQSPGFPTANVYHVESRLFEVLGVTKPNELPLDLLLNIRHYNLLPAVVVLAAFAIVFWDWIVGVLAMLFVVGTIFSILYDVHRYRQRAKEGNM